MNEKSDSSVRRWMMLGMLLLLSTNAGCSLEEALADGVFGGFSDAIAALIAQAFLTPLGLAS